MKAGSACIEDLMLAVGKAIDFLKDDFLISFDQNLAGEISGADVGIEVRVDCRSIQRFLGEAVTTTKNDSDDGRVNTRRPDSFQGSSLSLGFQLRE